jgi:hypothetical protein
MLFCELTGALPFPERGTLRFDNYLPNGDRLLRPETVLGTDPPSLLERLCCARISPISSFVILGFTSELLTDFLSFSTSDSY